ncbi:sigma-E factor negative regulatory protein [Hahella sp. CR1]|uniref:sigma-E factor negative regulatory protein n=1 Tax=Hahella sp. CR1 TaxID=2992807 RepID=UPI0024419ECB|nr:sigma-E factor negative regulatory protein [Hahella sp. CR1]MDG9671563.1 sigma-E factor negative regulatory protein [Hahella sp. CR1]
MNERLKESMSALLDGEADELEVRRILAQSHDEEVMATWSRYQRVRDELHEEAAQWAHVDLRQGIWSALEEEEGVDRNENVVEEEAEPEEARAGGGWWRGVAVAASVAFAAVFMVEFSGGPNTTQPAPAVASGQQSAPALNVNGAGSHLVADSGAESEDAVQFSAEHARRLNAYLMKHAEQAALNGSQVISPYARLSAFEVVEGQGTEQRR